MSRARLLALGAVLTAASLCVYLIEAQFPPLVPIPGVKLGLANIFTLFTCFALNASMALAVLLLRILLGRCSPGRYRRCSLAWLADFYPILSCSCSTGAPHCGRFGS